MTVDGETIFHGGIGPGFLDVGDRGGKSAPFVRNKRNDGFAVQVVIFKEGEHHLGIGTPPDGTTDEDSVVFRYVNADTLPQAHAWQDSQ